MIPGPFCGSCREPELAQVLSTSLLHLGDSPPVMLTPHPTRLTATPDPRNQDDSDSRHFCPRPPPSASDIWGTSVEIIRFSEILRLVSIKLCVRVLSGCGAATPHLLCLSRLLV